VSDETPWVTNEFAIGSRLAGYRLDAQIGRGGMAVVYRAYDPRLDRRVALKVLAPELARDESFRQRFIRESRAAAAVDHPNIIPVFEAGESEGVLFIAMRYVDGGDVGALIRPGAPLPATRVLGIITQVASALDAAHARGLVHRDVKPGNMLLDASAAADHVYLSDFGLSKQSLSSSHLTATGQFLGTLDYVAPEQIEGRLVDGRSDLYALACATFELLSGSPPFQREERLAALWAQLSEPPPALTSRRADLPPAVDPVLAKALAKSPDDRYQTCLGFAAALRDACGLGTGAAAPPAPAPGPGHTVVAPPEAVPAGPPAPAATGTSPPRPATATATGTSPPRPATGTDPPPPGTGTGPPGAATEAGSSRPATEAGSGTEAIRPVRRPREVTRPQTAAAAGPPAPTGGRDARPGRSWWRSPVALVAGVVVLLGLAGGGYAITRGDSNGSHISHGQGDTSKGKGKGGSASGKLTAISPPGCLTSSAPAPVLHQIRTNLVRVPGQPWAVVAAPGGWSFLTLTSGSKGSIEVVKDGSGLTPAPVRSIPVGGAPRGATLTPDGHYLLAADGSGAVAINVAQAEQGGSAVAGSLTSPGGTGGDQVRVTPDGHFAFVTLQSSNGVAVFDLQAAMASGFSSSHLVGIIPLGLEPVGLSFSPDGRWLYATTANLTKNSEQGGLSIIDVRQAETDPASALRTTVPAGCVPIRVITSDAGKYVWVTARDSNALLAFSAAKLLSDPQHALIARVGVGQGPIGITIIGPRNRIIVADSNLHTQKGATANLVVVDAVAALAGKPALLGVIPAGLLPRQLAQVPGSTTLLVSNSTSEQLQAVDISNLP
jgi:DNA-binding beta-propeller fold protein YncE/tRNA A-37 threonylcarbamoyl transferase component Bud32